MAKNTVLKTILVLVLLITVFLLISCRNSPQKPNPENQEKSRPKLPTVLEEMEEDALDLMFSIDGIDGVNAAIEENRVQKQQVDLESDVDLDKKEKEDIDIQKLIGEKSILEPILTAEEVEGQILELEDVPKDIGEIWFNIRQQANLLHRRWNVLEPKLQDAKVSKTDMEDFEKILDSLTLHIVNTNKNHSLFNINDLLKHLANFRSFFDASVPNEVQKSKYHVRQIILLAAINDFSSTLDNVKETENLANTLRPSLIEKDGEDIITKYDLSVEDLRRSVENEDFPIIQIKASIVMKNLQLMINLFESRVN